MSQSRLLKVPGIAIGLVLLVLLILVEMLFSPLALPSLGQDAIVTKQAEEALLDGEFKAGEVLVRLRNGVTRSAQSDLVASSGASSVQSIYASSTQLWEVPTGQELDIVSRLNADPRVEFSEPNYIYHGFGAPDDPYFYRQWAHYVMDTKLAWDITTGSTSLTVAIIDSGIDETHPDLQNKILQGYDFVDDDLVPHDLNGHGTHVAGIAAAQTNNSIGVAGMAWDLWILPVRVLGRLGTGSTTDIAAGIRWAYQHGAKILNLSLGGGNYSQEMQDAVNEAHIAGRLVVAAMGNCRTASPPECPVANPTSYPAAYDNVLAVSATDIFDAYASYSQHGDHCDVAAPGGEMSGYQDPGGVYSTMPTYDVYLTTDRDYSQNYDYLQGTSMAAPYVSGLAALVWSVKPSMTPDQVQAVIENTAVDLGPVGWDPDYGHGRVDPHRALLALLPTPIVVEPEYDSSVVLGEYAEIFVEALNAGDHSDEGGISVSFPSFTDPSDGQNVQLIHTSPDCEYTPHPYGSPIHDRDGNSFLANYLLVETVDSGWENSEENSLTIRVYPQEEGTFEFYVRSAMLAESGRYINDPSASGLVDQQGWEVYRYIINVGNSAPSEPHSPSPSDGGTDQSLDTDLNWSGGDPDGHAVSYQVRLEAGDEYPDHIVCTTSTTTCDPGPLAYYTEYFWRVTAVDQYGKRTDGPVWEFTTLPGSGPAVPSDLVATVTCQPSIQLGWNDNSSEESSFQIQRSVNSTTSWVEAGVMPRNTESYSDFDVACGNTYYYRVRAHQTNPDQYSSWSNVAQTDGCPSNLGSFSGHVRDAVGVPIDNATVVILSGPTLCSGSSGSDGYYGIRNLQPGIYAARAQKPGYDSDDRSGIAVTFGVDTPNQDFVLETGAGAPVVWGNEIRVTTREHASLHPDITVDSGGNVHLVWDDQWPDGGGRDIFYCRLEGISCSSIVRITPETSPLDSDSSYPRVTADPAGNAHIVWVDARASGAVQEIYYSKVNSSGSVVVDQRRITSDDGEEEHWVDVASDSSGNLHLVWRHKTETPTTQYSIHYTKLDNNGNALISDRAISASATESANYPRIAVDSNSHVHIVYYKTIGGYSVDEIYYAKLDNSGNVLVGNTEISAHDDYASKMPYLAVNSGDNVHVFWKDQRNSWTIYWTLLSSGGSTLVDDTEFGQAVSGWLGPAAILGSTGSVYATWQDDSDGNQEIYFNMRSSGGWASQTRVTHDPGSSTGPEIGADADSSFYIVWSDSRHGNDEIYLTQGTECSAPQAPFLLSPGDETRIGESLPEFSWESGAADASYELEISEDPAFGSSDTIVRSEATYTPSAPMDPGTYYWRVRVTTPCGTSDWSSIDEFTIVGEPAAPILDSPPNTGTTCNTTPTFTWNAVDHAIEYHLEVDDSSLFDSREVNASPSGTSYVPPVSLDLDTYYWRVSATNDFHTGPWSGAWTVSIKGVPPVPGSPSPHGGSVIDDRTPTLSWSAAVGANGYHLQVDSDDDFVDPILDETALPQPRYDIGTPVTEGTYYWRVRAIGPCGSSDWSTVWSFTVDDLQGPAIGMPSFPPTAASDESASVQVWVDDGATGGNGVEQARLCYGYTYPYAESCVAGQGPGGNGDGLWTFTISPQGGTREGQTLRFSLSASDDDDSPTTTSDDNGGSYYALSVLDDDTAPPGYAGPDPSTVQEGEMVMPSVTIVDQSGIYDTADSNTSVYVQWDTDGEFAIDVNELDMDLVGNGVYQADAPIGPFVAGAVVSWRVYAEDNDNSRAGTWSEVFVLHVGVSLLNDDLGGAILIVDLPYSNSQDTTSATTAIDDPTFTCVAGQRYNTVWYRYTAVDQGVLLISTSGSTYDTVLAVWTGVRGQLTCIACDDDSHGKRSQVEARVKPGTTYYIEIAGYSPTDSGLLTLSVDKRYHTYLPLALVD